MNTKIINRANLLHNLDYCKSKFANICAMVKADAYGHGAKFVVNTIKNKVQFFGVANASEALSLKKIAKDCNILIVGKSSFNKALIEQNISLTITDLSTCQKVLAICKKHNLNAKLHIAVNTGMNRLGVCSQKDFLNILNFIEQNKNYLTLQGVFTHCFDADIKKTHFYAQMKEFYNYVKLVQDKNVIVHIGGSYVLQHIIPSFVNMVRVGYFLYGYGNKKLKPVMRITSTIINIFNCKKGEYVGYGNTKLLNDAKIATISIGYGDGLQRRLSNNYCVQVNGKSAKIVGNVCMDMCMIDVTNISCKVGEKVTVLQNAPLMAKIVQTSPYEILTNFGSLRAKNLIID